MKGNNMASDSVKTFENDETNGWEWDTVAEEAATLVIFDTVGDVFIGRYLGVERIEPENDEPFERFTFRGTDNELYAVNKSYKLDTAMEKVQVSDWVRITYVKDIPTNRKQNPMKDFRVDVRKS